MRDICPGIFSTGRRERIAREGSGVGVGRRAEITEGLVSLADVKKSPAPLLASLAQSLLGQAGAGPAGQERRHPPQCCSWSVSRKHTQCPAYRSQLPCREHCPVSVGVLPKSREPLLEQRVPHLVTLMRTTGVPRKEYQHCPQVHKGGVGTAVSRRRDLATSGALAWQKGSRWKGSRKRSGWRCVAQGGKRKLGSSCPGGQDCWVLG